MKSIYSKETLQRILDHWGVGQIENITYFQNVGSTIWRHLINTNQGEFELFSYPANPTFEKEYVIPKLQEFLSAKLNWNPIVLKLRKTIHSFDRYHVLAQKTKKHRITANQAFKDLNLLIGMSIQKAFRVYGTILQIHLNDTRVDNADILSSYGWWSIQENQDNETNIIVDSKIDSYKQLDEAINLIEKEKPSIENYVLKKGWFEIYLSNGKSLHFTRINEFPAIEINLNFRKNTLVIFEENEIYYLKDL